LKNLNEDFYNLPFSHIYVEEDVWDHPRTGQILSQFPKAAVIPISNYKDVFCRSRQDVESQHRAQNLILARQTGTFLYEGAPVCQNFGNRNFYYTSCMMNCIFDCEYCYLKGMYPSGHMVLFVNIEDTFREVEQLLQKHPVYLCVSYDTDLLAMEQITGYVKLWTAFVECHPGLTIEIRTKSADRGCWKNLTPHARVIYAFTLSPEHVVMEYEHKTPSLTRRIQSAAAAQQVGFSVRLCFDPMIYCTDWRLQYEDMLRQVFAQIDMERLVDVSVGSFRVSQDYLKKMRKNQPTSPVVQFPYQNDHGVYHYPDALLEEMETYLVGRLTEKLPPEKIFRWEHSAKV
jgi:spore photoproduct lyase